ncbi:MAG: cupin domain-containing protein [Deltaproteobacteria bacterium]|nr:cupin domain-containing protein [Deltaproteobacteria bacterium]MBW2447040.1 cupin domain-containing protein [Deltaproteobacteria bacterium]
MKIVEFTPERAEAITNFGSVGASTVAIGDGAGEAHVYCIRFEAGGSIGRHPAGFGQLFLVTEGKGWVEGEDGERRELTAGQGASFARGEQHTKGSDHGMTAVMIQVGELEPRAGAVR